LNISATPCFTSAAGAAARTPAAEPAVDLVEHGFGHLVFPAREKVVDAALAQPGALADPRQAGALKAVGAKHLGQQRHGAAAFSHHSWHVLKTKIAQSRMVSRARCIDIPVEFALEAAIGCSLMLARRRCIRPSSANSQFSLP
jgi:hypothetical protein